MNLEQKPPLVVLQQLYLEENGWLVTLALEGLALELIPAPRHGWEGEPHPSDRDNIFLMACSGWLLFC